MKNTMTHKKLDKQLRIGYSLLLLGMIIICLSIGSLTLAESGGSGSTIGSGASQEGVDVEFSTPASVVSQSSTSGDVYEHPDDRNCGAVWYSSPTCYKATVTAYNTTVEQTDGNPCNSASMTNICGRDDVIACPRAIAFHTWVEIAGKEYECLDRTALQNDGRFDISFDKDVSAAFQWGKQERVIRIIN